MEFKIEGTLNLRDTNQVNAAIAFLSALNANPATETEVKKLTVVEAEVVEPAKTAAAKPAAAAKKPVAAKPAAAAKIEETEEEETPAAEAAREEAPKEEETTEAAADTTDFTKDDCREVLGAISLAGFKNEIKALLTSDFGVTSITSLSDAQVDTCYKALKKLADTLKVKLD